MGEGSVSVVWKYKDKETQEVFAVKTVRSVDPEILRTTRLEYDLMKQLRHEYVINVYSLFLDDTNGRIYTVMELVDAKEMFGFIYEDGPYTEDKAYKIFKKLMIGIKFMHDEGICHRDLKPQNVLVNQNGDIVKIADFNVSKQFAEKDKEKRKMLTCTGTLSYSAPEILFEYEYDEKVDV